MNIGDYVTRISHNHDLIFEIYDIKDDIAYLKGINERLLADAYLDDLIISENRDDFSPKIPVIDGDRDEYFYLPGKVLHIDGDPRYLEKSLKYYNDAGVLAVGKCLDEERIPSVLYDILNETKPDIVVITGHDAFSSRNNTYKNSKYFIESVRIAREYERSHEKLVVIAGACQSDYENLIKSGANYASSPKRINIHALDPAIIAVNISLTKKDEQIDIINLLKKTKYGKEGLGGIVGNGMMYVGFPR